jgi:hypothetical protein
MSTKITLATLAALLTAVSLHGTAFAQSDRDVRAASEHRASKAVHHARARTLSPTVNVPSDAYGSAATYSVPAAGHRNIGNNINPDFQLGGDY